MPVSNTVPPVSSGGGTFTLPNTQPATPGFWLNGGVLTFYNGTSNAVLDFNEGAQTSLFGTDLGDI